MAVAGDEIIGRFRAVNGPIAAAHGPFPPAAGGARALSTWPRARSVDATVTYSVPPLGGS